jgi:hypothetical protein
MIKVNLTFHLIKAIPSTSRDMSLSITVRGAIRFLDGELNELYDAKKAG